jgi:hypothetical protein
MKMAKPSIDKWTGQHWCKVQISYKDWMQLNHLTWRNWTLTMVHSWLSHMGGSENPNFISHFPMILATINLVDYLWWETPNLLIACNKTNLGVVIATSWIWSMLELTYGQRWGRNTNCIEMAWEQVHIDIPLDKRTEKNHVAN